MTFPTVGIPDEDAKAKIRAQFFDAFNDDTIDTSEVKQEEQPRPKRGPGRPPGSKNKPKPSDFAPHVLESERSEFPTLASPPLTQRDQKEVAKRLAGILQGVTGVASVAKPYFQMTEDEAEAIATPLSTYLIRQETTSGVAKQILEEYDVAAFVIALAAYVVRVYMDFAADRKSAKEESEPIKNVTPPESTPESKRETLRTVTTSVPESSVQSQEGIERPASRQFASTSERGWNPSEI